jgi:hypothetical protein
MRSKGFDVGLTHSWYVRRFFDKLMKDPSSELKQGGTDPSRFMRAIIMYQDPLELLARLTNPQVRIAQPRDVSRPIKGLNRCHSCLYDITGEGQASSTSGFMCR